MIKCWICNLNEANSEEHKFKASDIKKNFGKTFEASYFNGVLQDFTSYKDKIIKFPKVICIDCNNNKTRDADDAYNMFFESLDIINRDIESGQGINYPNVFGDQWKNKKIDLYRYFAKHAGCKMVTSEFIHEIDLSELSAFILEEVNINNFYIKIYYNSLTKGFNEQIGLLNKKKYRTNIAFGTTIFIRQEKNIQFCGSIIKGSLRIEWFYGNKRSLNTRPDFQNVFDNVDIMDMADFYPKSFNDENFINKDGDLISYLNFGKYHLSKELEFEHYFFEMKLLSK